MTVFTDAVIFVFLLLDIEMPDKPALSAAVIVVELIV